MAIHKSRDPSARKERGPQDDNIQTTFTFLSEVHDFIYDPLSAYRGITTTASFGIAFSVV